MSPLARELDFRVASNRFAVFWTAVAFVVVSVALGINDRPWSEAAFDGLLSAIGVFLAWAIGRELDPDHPATARWAGLLALLYVGVLGPPSLLASATVLVMGRILVRTTGLAPRGLDLVVLVIGGVLSAHTLAGATAALVLATALVVDLQMEDPAPTGPMAAAAVDILIGGAIVLFVADPQPWAQPTTTELLVAAPLVLALYPGPRARLRSVGDVTGAPLDVRRLAMARRLAIVAVPAAVLVGGQDEVARLTPVVAAVVGLGLNNIRRAVQGRSRAGWGDSAPDWTGPTAEH